MSTQATQPDHRPQAQPDDHVAQVLFVTNTGDGRRCSFAFLDDGRCAVLCNGHIEHACEADDVGVSAAFDRFFRLTHLDDDNSTGDRVPRSA